MLTEQFKTSMSKACDIVDASLDALIDGVEVRAINTVSGRRWRVAVMYDFGDGDTGTNRHGIPLYTDKAAAGEAARAVADYISKNLGGCKIPVFIPSLCDGDED
jgi:hypothetical protein